MACVEVHTSSDRGQILRCNCDVPAGRTLLVEPPILLSNSHSTKGLNIQKLLDDFCALPERAQTAILEGFYCPMESESAQRFLSVISEEFPGCKYIDRITRLVTIWHFNAAQACATRSDGSGPDASHTGRRALFSTACKAAHSCIPNASWYTLDAEGLRVMRSLVPICQGEEVFISYLSDEDLLLPKNERRAILLQTKEFHCECLRCVSDEDDTRAFKCPEQGCLGKRVFSFDSIGRCSQCAEPISASAATNILAQEKAVRTKMDYIDDVINTQKPIDVSKDVFGLSLGPLHEHHCLSCRLAQAQYDFYSTFSRPAEAAKALERHVARWKVVRLTRGAAFDYEFLGKAFMLADDAASACRCYAHAFAVHSIIQEPSHPYVLCISRKLANARLSTPANNPVDPALLLGRSVMLRGLQKKTFNGSVGQCGAHKQGRCAVELAGGCSISVKPVNLQLLLEDALKTGGLVVVFGLASQAGQALNGNIGSLGSLTDGRWEVQVEGHGLKRIRPENLAGLEGMLSPTEDVLANGEIGIDSQLGHATKGSGL